MASTYKLVIFDCDGVLVDSEPLALRVDTELFAELGWPLSSEEIARRFVGRTTDYMMGELAAHLGGPVPEDVDARFTARYREVLAAELRPVEGIVETLDRIAGLTCVASSGSHEKMRFTLGLTGLYERFDGRIFSATEVAHGKPEPDLFLHAARSLGVEPADCAVIEDSEYGVLAARAAGMTAYGYVGGGIIPAERLAGPGTTLFDDMAELPGLLGEE